MELRRPNINSDEVLEHRCPRSSTGGGAPGGSRFGLRTLIPTFALVVIVTAACSDDGTADEALAGDRLPVQVSGESYPGENSESTGIVSLDDGGCWTIDTGDGDRLLVFPEGYTLASSGTSMVSPEGTHRVGDADDLVFSGRSVPGTMMPGVPDGYWGNHLAFCEPEVDEFVIIDTVVSVGD